MIKKHANLEKLLLQYNDLGEASVEELIDAVDIQDKINYLDISSN